uniref:Hydroxymethylglutaryl-coenzyme A synthase C-terminal domain-containing protein n=1 Tax=Alexandrium catenella TaxID=2925 RepID=A0A7S1LW29_ALECA
MAFAGAGSTATLFFPDAPMPHHSTRASAVLHRFDFFKPVGWHDMAPITDGKYSVECYLDALDACYKTLRKKLNNRDVLAITDYNVFHTGGGYHIVRKAFERLVRNERPDSKGPERDHLVETKLNVSCSLLKIIGPCHTVSSFLNTSSVIMNTMEKGLGKVICVFTYGSGCAASMYQMRIDDVPYFDPIEIWKLKFYRNALKCNPEECIIHNFYVQTWMKFDYKPHGRKLFGVPVEMQQLDVYYLMEIDQWGRRFFHRGGMRAGAWTKEHKAMMSDNARHYDKTENRHLRQYYGDLPPDGAEYFKRPWEMLNQDAAQELEDKWRAIEFEMSYDYRQDDAAEEVVSEKTAKGNPDQQLVVVSKGNLNSWMVRSENDGQPHAYHIVGTWTCMGQPEEMQYSPDGTYQFEVTLGANGWEQFYIVQDGDMNRPIWPAYERSYKDMPCIGPTYLQKPTKFWLINGNPPDDLPNDDFGEPGDKYLVSFKWDNLKRMTWKKVATKEETYVDTASYWLIGSWTCWDPIEIPKDNSAECRFSIEVQKTPLDLKFQILRNQDTLQRIYPEIEEGCGDAYSKIALNEFGTGKYWDIPSREGDTFNLVLQRDPNDLSEVSVSWTSLGSRPVQAIPNRYFLIGTSNNWAKDGVYTEMYWNDQAKGYTCDVQLYAIPTEFIIIENKNQEMKFHPDKKDCSQIQAHEVKGPDNDHQGRNWHIGKSVADKARINDVFVVKLELEPKRSVTWKKKDL